MSVLDFETVSRCVQLRVLLAGSGSFKPVTDGFEATLPGGAENTARVFSKDNVIDAEQHYSNGKVRVPCTSLEDESSTVKFMCALDSAMREGEVRYRIPLELGDLAHLILVSEDEDVREQTNLLLTGQEIEQTNGVFRLSKQVSPLMEACRNSHDPNMSDAAEFLIEISQGRRTQRGYNENQLRTAWNDRIEQIQNLVLEEVSSYR